MPLNKESLLSGSKNILGSSIGKIGLVIGLVLLAFWYGTCHNEDKWREEYENYRESAQAAVNSFADSTKAVVDSLIQKSDALEKVNDTLSTRVAALDKTNKKLRDSLKVVKPIVPGELPPVCDVCVARLDTAIVEIAKRDKIIANRDSAIVVKDSIIANKEARILLLEGALKTERFTTDSLRQVILNMPKPPSPPKLLGLIKLSPTEAFLVGAAGTAITIAATSKD